MARRPEDGEDMTSDAVVLAVPVAGGTLSGVRWGPPPGEGNAVAVAAHGITSSRVFWSLVGPAVGEAGTTFVALDLRGRGDSADLPGPWGMDAHARDVVAVLDALDVARGVLVGHSMGGFVAAVTALISPERVAATLLVDGGVPLVDPLPPGTDVDAVVHAVVGPALDRLEQRFASREDAIAFWRGHPAFGAVPDDLVAAYADHDLTTRDQGPGAPPALRSRVDAEAVRADARDTLLNDDLVRRAAAEVPAPAVFLRAERGMIDQPEGLYPRDRLEEVRRRAPHVETVEVPGTNHYTIGMSPRGAAVVTDHVVALARRRHEP